MSLLEIVFTFLRTNIRRMYKNKLQNSVCRSVLKYIDSYIRDFIDIDKIVDKNCIIYIRTHVYEAIDKQTVDAAYDAIIIHFLIRK